MRKPPQESYRFSVLVFWKIPHEFTYQVPNFLSLIGQGHP